MKYYKTLNCYKNSSGKNYYNVLSQTATSYGWWIYAKRIGGLMVFNDYFYSSMTCQHQWKLRRLFRDLGIEIDLFIEAPAGLQDLGSATELYNSRIKALETLIAKPKSRKATNARRRQEIAELKLKIAEVGLLQAKAAA